jgi:GNAT superfamily N-acetyltransferase
MNPIIYRSNVKVSAGDFIDILNRSTLGIRRPVDDMDRIQRMLDHADILVTAWNGTQLVGVSRALTDFSFCCYLSDLAVDVEFQKKGIGKKLIEETRRAAGDQALLILLSAPAAVDYYPKIGLERFSDCFIVPKKTE